MTHLTAIICAHNPRADYLGQTLAALAAQVVPAGVTLDFLLIDNGSTPALAPDLTQLGAVFQTTRIVCEPTLGLTHARLRSFAEAQGEILLYIDDDNILAPDYIAQVLAAFEADPTLGAIGGKSLPRYETPPPGWFEDLGISLACRDLGEVRQTARWDGPGPHTYPDCAPVGAGMALRREAYGAYITAAASDPRRTALGRKGADLASGEDNDMVMSVLAAGWGVAYLPELSLIHLIPARRLTPAYLERYAESSNRTWVLVLDLHGIRPWSAIAPWTVPLRRARAWWRCRPWQGPAQRIAWKAACGQFSGRALLVAAG